MLQVFTRSLAVRYSGEKVSSAEPCFGDCDVAREEGKVVGRTEHGV